MNNQGLNINTLYNQEKKYDQNNISFDFLKKDLFPQKQNSKKKEIFFLELASMLEAGIDIKEAFEIIINQQDKATDRTHFESIKQKLIDGMSLSDALKTSNNYSPYEYYCVQIGEESGKLVQVLNELASFFTNKIKIRKQVIKSLSYPISVTITSVIAVAFMIAFVVPMFSDVFNRFGSELPAITKFFINLSNNLKQYFFFYLITILLITISFLLTWKNKSFKKTRQKFMLRIPVIGKMLSSIYLSRMCSSLTLLTSSHISLIQTLKLVSEMVDYAPIEEALSQTEKGIINGKPLYACMKEFSIFDNKMIALIKIGEETNKLDLFFNKLNQRFSNEVDNRTNTLNTFLEPVIIGFLGIMIGIILIAMYLPMFKLSTSIG